MKQSFHHLHTITLVLLFALKALAQEPIDNGLFNVDKLHRIHINSYEDIDLWELIDREYIKVKVRIGSSSIDSVGIKLKGSTSIYAEQKPLALDFNEYVKGQKYQGLTKLNLRNNFKDTTLMRERLAYEIYRRAGLPSPRTAYAEVYVNDTFRGIYTVSETVDKIFLRDHYPNGKGSLYKGEFDFRGFNIEVKEGTIEAYEVFERYNTPINLHEYVHLDHFLRQMAVDIIIGDWDSYAYHRHNFYIYHEPISQKLHFINWDHNYAFSDPLENLNPYPKGTFPSEINLIEEPGLRSKFEQTICKLLKYATNENYINEQIEKYTNILNSSQEQFTISPRTQLKSYISKRTQLLTDTLSNLGISCHSDPPVEKQEILINEIHYSTNGNWIELHNKTNRPIELKENYYLSNDVNFPKKWKIESNLEIPPRGYICLKENSSIDEEQIYAPFKIRKKGGTLILTHENLYEIHRITYPKLEKEMSFIREHFENGDNQLSQPTFKAPNSN